MNELADAIMTAANQEKQRNGFRELGEVVREALFPFDPGNMNLHLYEDASDFLSNRTTVSVVVDRLKDYPFRFQINQRDAYNSGDPQHYFLDNVAKPLFDHFRYRPSLPVDDHIILGEE